MAAATTQYHDAMLNRFLDVHTHNQAAPEGVSLINIPAEKLVVPSEFSFRKNCFYTAGIHPFFLDNINERKEALISLLSREDVVAIGECGLDKCCDIDYSLQKEVFSFQLSLAEKLRLPVIIHMVKAQDDLLSLCRNYSFHTPLIIHGFRGNPRQLEQLVRAGFSFSFGEHFNKATVQACPRNLLYTETDESSMPIEEIRKRISMYAILPNLVNNR